MFYESPRFPEAISYGAEGGPGYSTDVVTLNSGYEQRNANWSVPRASYNVSHGVKTQADMATLIAFFRLMQGRAHGFRYKDWVDFTDNGFGVFRALSATTFQMAKSYVSGASSVLRDIRKPVVGSIVITGGAGAVLDTTTGIVTVTSGTPVAWTGQFDVPCRFDVDEMKTRIDDYGAYTWAQIPLVELRG
ncbi:MAG: DUF2460 domain-containing protein [Rhodocyclaceae bacterium]|nr:DUF2460 domain-containing protein [Rhodocyclaceae bacterium]